MITFNALDWFDYAWHKVTEVKSGKYNSASVRRTNPASWEQITNWDWFTVFKLIYKIKRWFHHWISRSCECKACITSSQIVFACLLLFLFVLYLSICVLCVSIDSNPERQGGSCQMAFLAWYLCLYICLFVFVFFCICVCVFLYIKPDRQVEAELRMQTARWRSLSCLHPEYENGRWMEAHSINFLFPVVNYHCFCKKEFDWMVHYLWVSRFQYHHMFEQQWGKILDYKLHNKWR